MKKEGNLSAKIGILNITWKRSRNESKTEGEHELDTCKCEMDLLGLTAGVVKALLLRLYRVEV